MIDLPPLVHIGYHKTGSTMLQRTVFNRAEYGFFRVDDERSVISNAFINLGPFDEVPEDLVRLLREQRDLASSRNRVLTLSFERLSGYPASGGFDSRLIADRIHHVFPDAKILMLIREQAAVMTSFYRQYLTDGGELTFRDFLRSPQPKLFRVPPFTTSFFEYDKLIKYYYSKFGRDQIKVVAYESLRSAGAETLSTIFNFANPESATTPDFAKAAERRVNESFPIAFQLIRRTLIRNFAKTQLSRRAWVSIPYLNRAIDRAGFLGHPLKALEGPLRRRLQRQVKDAVANHYGPSNRRTAALTGLPLAELGYDVCED